MIGRNQRPEQESGRLPGNELSRREREVFEIVHRLDGSHGEIRTGCSGDLPFPVDMLIWEDEIFLLAADGIRVYELLRD